MLQKGVVIVSLCRCERLTGISYRKNKDGKAVSTTEIDQK